MADGGSLSGARYDLSGHNMLPLPSLFNTAQAPYYPPNNNQNNQLQPNLNLFEIQQLPGHGLPDEQLQQAHQHQHQHQHQQQPIQPDLILPLSFMSNPAAGVCQNVVPQQQLVTQIIEQEPVSVNVQQPITLASMAPSMARGISSSKKRKEGEPTNGPKRRKDSSNTDLKASKMDCNNLLTRQICHCKTKNEAIQIVKKSEAFEECKLDVLSTNPSNAVLLLIFPEKYKTYNGKYFKLKPRGHLYRLFRMQSNADGIKLFTFQKTIIDFDIQENRWFLATLDDRDNEMERLLVTAPDLSTPLIPNHGWHPPSNCKSVIELSVTLYVEWKDHHKKCSFAHLGLQSNLIKTPEALQIYHKYNDGDKTKEGRGLQFMKVEGPQHDSAEGFVHAVADMLILKESTYQNISRMDDAVRQELDKETRDEVIHQLLVIKQALETIKSLNSTRIRRTPGQ